MPERLVRGGVGARVGARAGVGATIPRGVLGRWMRCFQPVEELHRLVEPTRAAQREEEGDGTVRVDVQRELVRVTLVQIHCKLDAPHLEECAHDGREGIRVCCHPLLVQCESLLWLLKPDELAHLGAQR